MVNRWARVARVLSNFASDRDEHLAAPERVSRPNSAGYDHGSANPNGGNYEERAATEAWEKALERNLSAVL
jgi:hypothetical protein